MCVLDLLQVKFRQYIEGRIHPVRECDYSGGDSATDMLYDLDQVISPARASVPPGKMGFMMPHLCKPLWDPEMTVVNRGKVEVAL